MDFDVFDELVHPDYQSIGAPHFYDPDPRKTGRDAFEERLEIFKEAIKINSLEIIDILAEYDKIIIYYIHDLVYLQILAKIIEKKVNKDSQDQKTYLRFRKNRLLITTN